MRKIYQVLIVVIILVGLTASGLLGWRSYRLLSQADSEASDEYDDESFDSDSGTRRTGNRENTDFDAGSWLSPLHPASREAEGIAPSSPSDQAQEAESIPETPAAELSDELAPDFTMKDAEGAVTHLSEYYGQPIVVNFWASWCGPCMGELGHFCDAIDDYDGQVRFLMVNVLSWENDTEDNIVDWLYNNTEFDFPVLFDNEESGVNAYEISAIPVTLFIYADGSLNRMQIGSMDKSTLYSFIDEILH